MADKKIDGYWLNMGGLICNALGDVLAPNLTERRKEIVREYLGEMLDNAYEMGIKLGEARERYCKATANENAAERVKGVD